MRRNWRNMKLTIHWSVQELMKLLYKERWLVELLKTWSCKKFWDGALDISSIPVPRISLWKTELFIIGLSMQSDFLYFRPIFPCSGSKNFRCIQSSTLNLNSIFFQTLAGARISLHVNLDTYSLRYFVIACYEFWS